MASTPVPHTPSLEILSISSDYMKLLEYAVLKIGVPFTAADAQAAIGITPTSFESLKFLILYQTTDSGLETYNIMEDSFHKYVELLQFMEAREYAVEAKKEAANARLIAIIAITLSAIFSVIQVAYQAYGSTKIDEAQIKQLLSPVPFKSAIETTDSPQLEKLRSQVDLNHQALVLAVRDLQVTVQSSQRPTKTLASPTK